jgi:methionyl-tRNA synthetase
MDAGAEVDIVMGDALEVIRHVAIMISPVMPRTAAEIWRRIGLTEIEGARWSDLGWGRYPKGRNVVKGDPLFPRISSDS